jgi:hypothetical protein
MGGWMLMPVLQKGDPFFQGNRPSIVDFSERNLPVRATNLVRLERAQGRHREIVTGQAT